MASQFWQAKKTGVKASTHTPHIQTYKKPTISNNSTPPLPDKIVYIRPWFIFKNIVSLKEDRESFSVWESQCIIGNIMGVRSASHQRVRSLLFILLVSLKKLPSHTHSCTTHLVNSLSGFFCLFVCFTTIADFWTSAQEEEENRQSKDSYHEHIHLATYWS